MRHGLTIFNIGIPGENNYVIQDGKAAPAGSGYKVRAAKIWDPAKSEESKKAK